MAEKKTDKEKTMILNTRDLMLIFVFFVIVLAIVFTIGLIVGRNMDRNGELAGQPAAGEEETEPLKSAGASQPVQEMPLPPAGTDSRSGLPPIVTEPAASLPSTGEGAAAMRQPAAGIPDKSTRGEEKPAVPAGTPRNAPGPSKPPASAPADAPPASPAAAAPAAAGETFFVVQAMASRDQAEARKMVQALKAKGFDAFAKPPAGADTLYRVQVGRFRDRQHAQERVNQLKQKGFQAFIRSVTE